MDNIFLNYGMSYEKCDRKHMEDYNKIYITDKIKYFSICDGHGGDLISKVVNDRFLQIFLENYCFLTPYNYINFFTDIAINLDNEIRFKKNIGKTSGTTFICAIMYDNYLYIINIGDSVANININNKIIFKNLRHTPDKYIEKKRITKTLKIINNRINGLLNVSRAFGDFYLKSELISSDLQPVSCVPDIKRYNINTFINKKSFILLASDGILLQFPLDIINEYIYNKLINGFDPQIISDKLIDYYKKVNNKDNVTIIIITLNNFLSN